MDTRRHQGMWFNPELPGYHCPRCRVSITLEKLADIPRKYWTEHARVMPDYKHVDGSTDLMVAGDTGNQGNAGYPLQIKVPVPAWMRRGGRGDTHRLVRETTRKHVATPW